MELNISRGRKMDSDIYKHCHINSNKDGDRFVGVKADSNNAIVYFPIGYELPETDAEIRLDIKHLIRILSEFTTKSDRLLAVNKFLTPQNVDFPINAYRGVIEYYLSNDGKYYVETDPSYKGAASGHQDWTKTIKNKMPLIQKKGNVSSFIYTDFIVRTIKPNETKQITQINRYCVYEAFEKLGWLYIPFMPEEPGPHPDIRTSLAILREKVRETNDDKKRMLFQNMKSMLEYLDERTLDNQVYFGTEDFDHVWEKLIDRMFGERDKEQYFPRSRWLLDYGPNREKRPLLPDSIMIYNNKYYILDAKYYKYGWTGISGHLPDASSINKQITYGEYLERKFRVEDDSLFNAFVMPFNKAKNFFNIESFVGNIGEAVGDWRNNRKNYERIQGIVIDTRYLMYHYIGNHEKEKRELAECIESVLARPPVSPPTL